MPRPISASLAGSPVFILPLSKAFENIDGSTCSSSPRKVAIALVGRESKADVCTD